MKMSGCVGRLFPEKLKALHTRHSSWAGSRISQSHTACFLVAGGCCSRCQSSFCSDIPGNKHHREIMSEQGYPTDRKNCAVQPALHIMLHSSAHVEGFQKCKAWNALNNRTSLPSTCSSSLRESLSWVNFLTSSSWSMRTCNTHTII